MKKCQVVSAFLFFIFFEYKVVSALLIQFSWPWHPPRTSFKYSSSISLRVCSVSTNFLATFLINFFGLISLYLVLYIPHLVKGFSLIHLTTCSFETQTNLQPSLPSPMDSNYCLDTSLGLNLNSFPQHMNYEEAPVSTVQLIFSTLSYNWDN